MKSVFHLCLYLFHNLPRTHFLFWKSHKQQHVCYHQGLLWTNIIRIHSWLSHNLKILHIPYFMRLCHTNVKWILLFANTGAVVLIKELCLFLMTLGFNSKVYGWGPHHYETITYVTNQTFWLDSKHYMFVEIRISQVHLLNIMTQLFINMIQSYWLKYLVILLIQYFNPIFV